MALRIRYEVKEGEFGDAFGRQYQQVAKAATAAITLAGNFVKAEGRAQIRAAGFSARWQNALRVDVFPKKGKASANAAAWVFHKIKYAEIFETGGTITGAPPKSLWLPLKTAPDLKRGPFDKKITPKLYRERVGPLRYLARPGHKPLLVADIKVGARQAQARGPVSLATLRRGTKGKGRRSVTQTIPIFVLIPAVRIKPKLSIRKICQQARDNLPRYYANLIVNGGD